MKKFLQNAKGFTLVELIIVIAIIAVLAAAVLVGIDPAKRLHEANNARRRTDIANILDAVVKYQAENTGNLPTAINTANLPVGVGAVIGTDADGGAPCTADKAAVIAARCSLANLPNGYIAPTKCIDLSASGLPIATIPQDPTSGSAANTFYYMTKPSAGTLAVVACGAQDISGVEQTISIAR